MLANREALRSAGKDEISHGREMRGSGDNLCMPSSN